MSKKLRENKIRLKLINEKKVYVSDLARTLCVAERTIRRDLKVLSDEGVANLFFGGAILNETAKFDDIKKAGITSIMDKLNYDSDVRVLNKRLTSDVSVYVLGSFNIDITSEVESFPKVGETIKSLSTNFYAGGKGSNQALAAAQLSDAVHLTVKIGNDEFGEKAKKFLSGSKINSTTVFTTDEVPTGNAIIMTSNTEADNMIAIDLGANESFTYEEIVSEFGAIRNSRVFLAQLENNIEITKAALELAFSTDSLVILNPAPYSIEINHLIPFVDIITPNETEASAISGIEVHDLESAKSAAQLIYNMGSGIVIITMGAKGCLVYDGEKHHHVECYKSVVADTCGAGDSFNGALAAQLSSGKTILEAVKYASAFASLAVERKGASNMPTREQVEARISQQSTVNNF